MSVKYIFVTGGVVSGLGKGITAASLGRLLKERGLKVTNQKLDPYLNVDPGTMSPYQHGEVFVTDDGAETDLDLGHYERFTDENLTVNSSVTSGKVYWNVLNRERQGEYLRRHHSGHPPHHQRDQRAHLPHGQDQQCGRVHHRGRRHRGRHRVPALPGGHPPGGPRAAPGGRHVRPRLSGGQHSRLRRAQEQAHPALLQGAAEHRHPARRDRLPRRSAPDRGHPPQDLHVLQHPPGECHPQPDRPHPLRGAPDAGGGGSGRCGGASASAWTAPSPT